jgi:hypothetical protein
MKREFIFPAFPFILYPSSFPIALSNARIHRANPLDLRFERIAGAELFLRLGLIHVFTDR